MPHDNGRIYSEVVNGVKVGINTDDVKVILGCGSDDVATLCTFSGINKWNKNKPYRGTSPVPQSRTVTNDNGGDNGSGMYLGNRGRRAGYPVYWGMEYPMNTNQQTGLTGDNRLFQLCYNAIAGKSIVSNYEYNKPVIGTDFCRLDDFDGYFRFGGAFLEAGVEYAKTGESAPAEASVNSNTSQNFSVYARVPSNAYGWTLKDLIADAEKYYLCAEIYKVNDWKDGQNTTLNPVRKYRSTTSLASATGTSIGLTINIADIKSGLGNPPGDFAFIVCVGFNKFESSSYPGQSAFIAPWNGRNHTCATLMRVFSGSPFNITIKQYAVPASTLNYVDFPDTWANPKSRSLYFKTEIYNGSNSDMTIWLSGSSVSATNKLTFRAYGVGNYTGTKVNLKIYADANQSSSVNNIVIPKGQTKTVYFFAENILPQGASDTSTIIFEVSPNDTDWTPAGMVQANFRITS